MSKIVVNGGKVLNGEIRISGAKNSVVALICASVLTDDVVYLDSVPNISDVRTLIDILESIGCITEYKNEELMVDPRGVKNVVIPEDLANQLRASYYFLGSFLGKFNSVEFGLPGGCNLGARPIDLHLFGFERLNCNIEQKEGKYFISTDNLQGNKVFLDFASVGATINVMLAAVRANGHTIIENAAEEPEIVDVANFLNSMGAKVRGAGTSVIRIEGVNSLGRTRHQVVPDRIQAGTYILLGALCCDKLVVKNVIGLHLDALLSKLDYAGVKFEVEGDKVVVYGRGKYNSFDIMTQTYPGFPTDLQQPLTTFLTQCEGIGTITETIYTERFRHIDHLNSMGANIKRGNDSAIVMGPIKLYANKVVATDLRASSALVLAALLAEGKTTILDVEHLIRGYDDIVEKLQNIGADIEYFE
ncbi:MAG: UDP-N-acetylglucosamine 1-carboxyvinyltransferase [Bacilli bacterium]